MACDLLVSKLSLENTNSNRSQLAVAAWSMRNPNSKQSSFRSSVRQEQSYSGRRRSQKGQTIEMPEKLPLDGRRLGDKGLLHTTKIKTLQVRHRGVLLLQALVLQLQHWAQRSVNPSCPHAQLMIQLGIDFGEYQLARPKSCRCRHQTYGRTDIEIRSLHC